MVDRLGYTQKPRLFKAYSPSYKDSTWIKDSYGERDRPFVVDVCQVLVYVICKTITKRDRPPFTPTLVLSLNKIVSKRDMLKQGFPNLDDR